MTFSTSQLRLSLNIAWACISLVGASTAARADTNPPGTAQPALFSWDEIPPSRAHPSLPAAGKITVPGDPVLQTVLQDFQDPKTPRDDFWNQNQRWAGILQMSDGEGAPAYSRFVTALKRAASSEAMTDTMEPAFALAGLAIAGVFMLRYLGKLYYSQLFYHDCGRRGGYLLASNNSGHCKSRSRPHPASRAWQWLPRLLKRKSPEFGRAEKPLSVNG